ncbi:hypothetical protein PoB_004335700 [Plakobranchus ocellatus]|uniref:Uncharacterized protein n=1 Tax=Plakobranchus ocellatus TaxID=259542 RepID=A0AAV4BBQ2_9GAST|nr:hypothetical protein PoB_004335700 [Plakobranchus ocellatus]
MSKHEPDMRILPGQLRGPATPGMCEIIELIHYGRPQKPFHRPTARTSSSGQRKLPLSPASNFLRYTCALAKPNLRERLMGEMGMLDAIEEDLKIYRPVF